MKSVVCVCVSLALSGPAFANKRPASYTRAMAVENADANWRQCLDDFNTFCPGRQRQHNMGRCLWPHRTEVSASCTPVLNGWCPHGCR